MGNLKRWALTGSFEGRIHITGITSGESFFPSLVRRTAVITRLLYRWTPFDTARNWPDLGPRFEETERIGRMQAKSPAEGASDPSGNVNPNEKRNLGWEDRVADDKRDLDWSTVMKRTFESYIRGERPNMYGEWMRW